MKFEYPIAGQMVKAAYSTIRGSIGGIHWLIPEGFCRSIVNAGKGRFIKEDDVLWLFVTEQEALVSPEIRQYRNYWIIPGPSIYFKNVLSTYVEISKASADLKGSRIVEVLASMGSDGSVFYGFKLWNAAWPVVPDGEGIPSVYLGTKVREEPAGVAEHRDLNEVLAAFNKTLVALWTELQPFYDKVKAEAAITVNEVVDRAKELLQNGELPIIQKEFHESMHLTDDLPTPQALHDSITIKVEYIVPESQEPEADEPTII